MRRQLLALAIMLASALSASAKLNKQEVYVYGFAASFNDSTIYFADIQFIPDGWIETKHDFLYGRDSYSCQLRDYLKTIGCNAPTCVTGFAKTRKKAEEKYLKLRSKYISKGTYNIKYVNVYDFRYKAVSPDESEMTEESSAKKPDKQTAKADKTGRKTERKGKRR